MNKIIVTGNLTADPEERIANTAAGQKVVCNFTVAANRFSGGQKVAEYFRVSVWEKQAENILKYMKKGSKILVEGCVTARAYIGSDGQARAQMEIVNVSNYEFLSSRQDEQAAQAQTAPQAAARQNAPQPVQVYPDELPF